MEEIMSAVSEIKEKEEKKLAKLIKRKAEEIDFDDVYYVYGQNYKASELKMINKPFNSADKSNAMSAWYYKENE